MVFPHPDSPTTPRVSWARSVNDTSSTARTRATTWSNTTPFLTGKYKVRWSTDQQR